MPTIRFCLDRIDVSAAGETYFYAELEQSRPGGVLQIAASEYPCWCESAGLCEQCECGAWHCGHYSCADGDCGPEFDDSMYPSRERLLYLLGAYLAEETDCRSIARAIEQLFPGAVDSLHPEDEAAIAKGRDTVVLSDARLDEIREMLEGNNGSNWWATECGHHQNACEDLLYEVDRLRRRLGRST